MNTHQLGNVVILRGALAGGGTELAANVEAGGSVIPVYNITGYTNNDPVIINPGGKTEERRLVSGAPSGLNITLNSVLLHKHVLGEIVGEGATPGTVVCTVKAPNGTTSTPATSAIATGVYEAEYTPTLEGVHEYEFASSSGADAKAEGRFNVRDSII